MVWWLIAMEERRDALRLLDVLCELDDQYYWMFQALASVFATRAWLHAQNKSFAQSADDANRVAEWLRREPNAKPITKKETQANLRRFGDWVARAENERGDVTAANVLAHALRVLVIYDRLAAGGCQAAQVVPAAEYESKIQDALVQLRDRLMRCEQD
jgi:hypothetical protein